MREATGELNMTVVTVVAIAAVAALFYAFVWPSIQSAIRNQSCSAITDQSGQSYHAVKSDKERDGKAIWVCCAESYTSPKVSLDEDLSSTTKECTDGMVD